MVNLGMYEFKKLNTGNINPEKLFINDFVEEIYESEQIIDSIKHLRVILDAKYEKSNLIKVVENQCQNLTETQRK